MGVFYFHPYLSYMEKGLDKLLKKLVIKKYPVFLDVYAVPYEGAKRYSQKKSYDVFLVINENDYMEDMDAEIGQYVMNIAKHMDVEIMRVYYQVVDDAEWEEMKSGEKF